LSHAQIKIVLVELLPVAHKFHCDSVPVNPDRADLTG
jgi:hypothetical protein